MQRALAEEGITLGKRRIIQLMKAAALVPKKRRLFKKTTVVDNRRPVAKNQLKPQFEASKPNEQWVADIPYVFTPEGWLY